MNRDAHIRVVEDELVLRRALRANLQLADELGAQVVRLPGNVAAELIAYAQPPASRTW
jgi:hypothetical protein